LLAEPHSSSRVKTHLELTICEETGRSGKKTGFHSFEPAVRDSGRIQPSM
jgi:hypothetical protein